MESDTLTQMYIQVKHQYTWKEGRRKEGGKEGRERHQGQVDQSFHSPLSVLWNRPPNTYWHQIEALIVLTRTAGCN